LLVNSVLVLVSVLQINTKAITDPGFVFTYWLWWPLLESNTGHVKIVTVFVFLFHLQSPESSYSVHSKFCVTSVAHTDVFQSLCILTCDIINFFVQGA